VICIEENCTRQVRCRGRCRSHYGKWLEQNRDKVQTRIPRDGICNAAGCERPIFAKGYCGTHYDRQFRHGDLDGLTKTCETCDTRFKPHGRQRWCWECAPDEQARSRIRRYGISAKVYIEMLAAQDGLCAVCRIRPPEAVDHCHATGVIRGLLCLGCNGRLSVVDDRDAVRERRWSRCRVDNVSTVGAGSSLNGSDYPPLHVGDRPQSSQEVESRPDHEEA
jgi:hypothetical protein